HASAVLSQLAAQVFFGQLQTGKQFLPKPPINPPALQTRKQVENLDAGKISIDPQLARQVSNVLTRCHTTVPAIVTKDKGAAAGRSQQIEQQSNGRGFAGAIQAKKTQDLPLRDLQI